MMNISKFSVWGNVHNLVKAAERLEGITPLTVSQLQRKLALGYGRAFMILELFGELGIVTPPDASGDHRVLVSPREAVIRVTKYLYETLSADETQWKDYDPQMIEEELAKSEAPVTRKRPGGPLFIPDTPDNEEPASAPFSFDSQPADSSPALDSRTVNTTSLSPAELLRRAVEVACSCERIGTSNLQRTLQIGYGRAAALIDTLERLGIVGSDSGKKTGRDVLLPLEEALARLSVEEG